jgi:hypothetical protein
MSVRRVWPWTSHEDLVLQELAVAGESAATIAAEMARSEAAIRRHSTRLNLTLAKGQPEPKAKK